MDDRFDVGKVSVPLIVVGLREVTFCPSVVAEGTKGVGEESVLPFSEVVS